MIPDRPADQVVAVPALAAAGEPPVIDRGRSAALTAIGQVFVLVGASLIGVVVAATLSPGARLDAYFTANQLTVAALYVGQALRTSVPGFAAGGVIGIPVLARASALMTGAVAVVLLLGVAVGPSLVTEESGSAMRSDLLVLLPGAVLQVAAGYWAGRLAMGGRFAGAALAYAAGTVLNALLLVVFIGGAGAGALAPAALAGWLTSAVVIALLYRRRPVSSVHGAQSGVASLAGPVAPVGVVGAASRITLSVTPVLAAQLVIVAAVTAATHVRGGGSTIVSLAFLAMNAIGTVAVAPIPIVLSADLGSRWDRRTESLIPLMMRVVRLAVAVMMPLVLGLVLVGWPIADLALAGLSPKDVDDLFTVVLILLPSLPLTAASMVALVAVFALDRLAAVARLVTAAALGAAASIVLVVVVGGTLAELAVVASIWSAVLGVATLTAALGAATPRAVLTVLGQAASVAAPAVLVVAGALLSGTADALVPGVLWAAAGVVIHLGWLRLRHPDELAVLLGVVRR